MRKHLDKLLQKIAKHIPANQRPRIAIVLSLFGCSLAFISSSLFWLVFISLVPIYVYFDRYSRRRGLKQILIDFYTGGYVFSLVVLFWMVQADISRWMDISGLYAYFIRFLALAITSAFFAVGFLLLGAAVYVLRNKPRYTFMFVFPIVWALSEIVRSYAFAFISYGPGASFEPNWNFGALGLASANSPLGYASRPLGLFGLSAITVFFSALVYYLAKKDLQKAAVCLAILLVPAYIGWKICAPAHQNQVTVAVVHIGDNYASLEEAEGLFEEAASVDIVVMPEHSEFFDNAKNKDVARKVFGRNTTIITSQKSTGIPPYNQLTVYDSSSDSFNYFNKRFIIPGGETLPYTAQIVLKLTGGNGAVSAFHDTQQIRRGETALPVIRAGSINVGPSVCSSVLSPVYFRKLKKNGAQIFTNSASLAFLSDAPLYHVQEKYLLKFQALSNATPLAHSSRTGTSMIIDGNGKTIQSDSSMRTIILQTSLSY